MSRSRIIFLAIVVVGILAAVIIGVVRPQIEQQGLTAAQTAAVANRTTIVVNYGTEKRNWLEAAVVQFEQQNPGVDVQLVGQGSMQAYQELSGITPEATRLGSNPIPVLWSPASSIQTALLQSNSTIPDIITQCQRLVLSPLVIIAWEDRAKVFEVQYKDKGGITFQNIVAALTDPALEQGKWSKLSGGQEAWGFIKVGHTNPQTSNSGVMMLVAMANNLYDKRAPITDAEATQTALQTFLAGFNSGLTPPAGDSTGTLMNDVVIKGPSSYDFVVVYEALALENYKNAVGRQGQPLRIIYPKFNVYSDHPMCVVNHPSLTQAQKDTALKLQQFLLTPDMQKLAVTYGYRPADVSIPIFGVNPPSPFDDAQLKAAGVGTNIGQELQLPGGGTLFNLLQTWQRVYRS